MAQIMTEETGVVGVHMPLSTELIFALFFAIAFALLRPNQWGKPHSQKGRKCTGKLLPNLITSIKEKFDADDTAGVLETFRAHKHRMATPLETLRLVARAGLVELKPQEFVRELVEHMRLYRVELGNAKTAHALMGSIACCNGAAAVMVPFWNELKDSFNLHATAQTMEILLTAHVHAGNHAEVASIMADMEAADQKISSRGHAALIRGFQMQGDLDAALKQWLAMGRSGCRAPAVLISELVHWACSVGRARELVERTRGVVQLSVETISVLLEYGLKHDDVNLACLLDDVAQESNVPLCVSAYDSLLKIYTCAANPRAMRLFEDMQKSGLRISEGLCVGLVSRCAAPKFRCFAEEVVRYVRSRDKMTLNMYSALMKVYAYDGLYNKACGLYEQLLADGLEPDNIMNSCLMKFALECGRTDLLETLSRGLHSCDLQQYTLLIRACGQNNNLDKAFELFRQVSTGREVDVTLYNVLLDVCVRAGAMDRARGVVRQMSPGLADEVTFNVLLKGYCAAGDEMSAKQVLCDMEKSGCAPNTTALNCLLNMACSSGSPVKVWKIIEMMESRSVRMDSYTISTLMKIVRHSDDPAKDLRNILSLLDRSGLDICGEDILFSTVLEACCKQRMFPRIEDILKKFEASASASRASMHTHAVVIKAYGLTHRVDKCRDTWRNLVDQRELEPSSIVIGCMLDALVCNSSVEEAIKLFKEIRARGISVNPVMYSTLMKGITAQNNPEGVLEMFNEMRAAGVKPNTASYNCVIDSLARRGHTQRVDELVRAMEEDGCEASDITYSMVIKAYCVKGDLDDAMGVFKGMVVRKSSSLSSAYNTLLDACIQFNRSSLSDELVQGMDSYGVVPSTFTLVTHIKYYGRAKRIDAAAEAIEAWPSKYGITPNMAASTCFIRACIHAGATERGVKVMRLIIDSGSALDAKSCRSLVISCIFGGLLQDAVTLVEAAFGFANAQKRTSDAERRMSGHAVQKGREKVQLEADLLEKLLGGLLKQGMVTTARPLLKKLQGAGVSLNHRLVAQVLGNK